MLHTIDNIRLIEKDIIAALGGDSFKERHNAFFLWVLENPENKVEIAYGFDNPKANRMVISYADDWDAFEVRLYQCKNPYKIEKDDKLVANEMPVYYYEVEEACNEMIKKHCTV